MVTKAIIRALPYNADNIYLVEIPIFNSAGIPSDTNLSASYMQATLSHQPGIIHSYSVGDVVFVTFEDNQLSKPIILGKLYLNENENAGYALFGSLDVSDSAKLPLDTMIGDISGKNLEEYGRRISNLENSSGGSGDGNVDDVLVNDESVVVNKIARVNVPTNYVTTDTNQNISGIKTFEEAPQMISEIKIVEYIQPDQATFTSAVFPFIKSGVVKGDCTTGKLTCILDGYFLTSQRYGFCGYDSGGQLGQSNGKWSCETSTSNISALTRTTVVQVIDFLNSTDTLYINGTQIAQRSGSGPNSMGVSNSYPIFVAYSSSGYVYNPANLRLYSFKMYDGDGSQGVEGLTLLRDFAPAILANNSYGLYDKVTHQQYYNLGIGDFTVSSTVIEIIEAVAHLVFENDLSRVGITGEYNDLLNKPTVPTTTSQLTNNSGFITSAYHDSTKANQSEVTAIQEKIPSAASSSNQLADKAFVNSSIETATATFRGTFESLQELEATSGDLNDYAFYKHTDDAGNTVFDRYKYVNTTPHWVYEYTLNNSSFTATQWAAINSGVTVDNWVDMSTAQTISGQKDFNTIPRVKVEHETHNLPSEYQEVEYIESSGTQYIDTGLIGTINTSYLVTAQAASNTAMLLFGSRTSATSNNLMCTTSDTYCLVDFGNYQQTRLQIVVSTNKFTAYNSKNLRYINDNQSTIVYSGQLTTPDTMRIFDLSGTPPTGNVKWSGKLFVCKVWESDILLRDFIPCYRKSDNEVGLYDIVNDVFYTNQGTGSLMAGSDISPVTYENLLTDASFAPVAFSGSYNDLLNKPTIPTVNNGTLTIQKNGTTVNTFTANTSSNVTANITVPTQTSELTNNSGYISINGMNSGKLLNTSNDGTSIDTYYSPTWDFNSPANDLIPTSEAVRSFVEGKGYITLSDVPKKIFVCTYGTTTYAEVTQALSDGKIPVVLDNNIPYIYSGIWSQFYTFSRLYNINYTNAYSLYLNSTDNSWSRSSGVGLERTTNKVTSISSSNTNTQYPSAKCVYDNIENVREVAEGKSTNYVINSKSEITGTEDSTTHNYSNVSAITGIDISRLKIGDNIYIKDMNTPDYWVSRIYTDTTSITNLTSTTWLFNVSPNTTSRQLSVNIKLTDDRTYEYIAIEPTSNGIINYRGPGFLNVFINGSWNDESYRTITITGGSKVQDIETINYFKNNAILVDGNLVVDLSKLETVKPNIASISVNGTNIQPVLENVDIVVPTKTSDLTNDSEFITLSDVPIKTISVNNTQVLPVSENVNIDLYSYHDATKQNELIAGNDITLTNVEEIGKNKFNMPSQVASIASAQPSSNIQIYSYMWYFGFAYNGNINKSTISNYSLSDNAISFKSSDAGSYGICKFIQLKPNTTYTLSVTYISGSTTVGKMALCKYKLVSNNTYKFNKYILTPNNLPKTFTTEVDDDGNYLYGILLYATTANTECTYSNIQIEEGSSVTPFMSYSSVNKTIVDSTADIYPIGNKNYRIQFKVVNGQPQLEYEEVV